MDEETKERIERLEAAVRFLSKCLDQEHDFDSDAPPQPYRFLNPKESVDSILGGGGPV